QVPAAGVFPGSFGPDYGLSIDVALALDAVDADAATVTKVRDAIAADVNGYIAYSYNDGSMDHTGETGGATAKALLLAQRTGGNPVDFGGVNLVQRLESLIDTNGRVISTFDGAPDPSYDNTYIQTLALDGLDGTGSSAHGKLLDYLLDQQCTGGFFRGDIDQAQQQCGADEPDTDSTAQAVVALLDETDPAAVTARTQAVQWLLSTQQADGSFGGGPS
ncbi:prenyltransferase/squalene oxidase repeat-containing protein, partial [Nocardioides hankookensis]